MYLRRHRRTVDQTTYEYWTLVESRRTASGPRQHTVASLGKLPGLDEQVQAGWESVDDLLAGQTPARQLELKGSPAPPAPLWCEVDVRGVRVERVREFGEVYLALSLWRRLGLHTLLEELLPPGREAVPWSTVACLLTVARFCAQPSELGVAERWYQRTALEDLLGVPWEQINDDRLYRGLDALHEHKEKLTQHLLKRYESWFGVNFEFLLYDVTSTFFEGQAAGNTLAARGYSRDNRPDCPQVCIGLVVSPEGLPLAYELFAGNRTDVTTMQDIVQLMEEKYGRAKRIWVMDRGMVSEPNIEFLRARQAQYIVGTPKAQLRQFEAELLETKNWRQVRAEVEVKLLPHPDGKGQEQFVLCRSQARQEKEKAMLARQEERLWQKLCEIQHSLAKKPQPADQIERRVGRWLGRYPAADKLFEVAALLNEQQQACGLSVACVVDRNQWVRRAQGAYLLRTNCTEQDPAKVWEWYLQLQQAEAAFRCAKSDLGLRPVFHQKTERVEAHILVCFLSLALWRTLEMWMQGKGLGTCARQLVGELATIKSMDVILPLKAGESVSELRLNACPKNWRTPITLYLGIGSEQRRGLRACEAIQACALIHSLRSPVHTVGLGLMQGFEPLVLASGQPGQRHLLPQSLIFLGELEVDDVHQLPNGNLGLANKFHRPSIREQAKSLIKIQIRQLTKDLGLPRNLWSRPRMITATQAIKLAMADALVSIPTPQLILNFEKSPDHEIIHTPNEP